MAQAQDQTNIIGRGITIRGNLSGGGDLVIEGQVEGRIQTSSHVTIEPSGVVNASIEAEKLTMKSSAKVEGEVRAPSVVIEDGASFRGVSVASVTHPICRVLRG